MAREMSDSNVARNLRAAATQYFWRAFELERPPATVKADSPTT
jgi:hypothetical protein